MDTPCWTQLMSLVGSSAQHASNRTTVAVTSTATASAAAAATTSGGLLVDYAPATSDEIYSLAMDCVDGGFYAARKNNYTPLTFRKSCRIGLDGGDVSASVAYSFNDCIEACAALNNFQGGDPCTQVVFHSIMIFEGLGNGINCWLKNSNAILTEPYSGEAGMKQYSAVAHLIQDDQER